jgi:hypothetical protein
MEGRGLAWVVLGRDGEKSIRAEGSTRDEALSGAADQAWELEIVGD